MAFINSISATKSFTYRSETEKGGCRHIYTKTYSKDKNGEKYDRMQRIVFFHQNCNETKTRIGSVRFVRSNDYYISKNSFFADRRTKDALFSFDNIVIDIDMHKGNITTEELDFQTDKLLYILQCDYKYKFPAFNLVRTGRGIQIWIGLQSFSALVEAFRRRYTTVCEYFCNLLDTIIEENNIPLEVDHGASTDATRLARIPYTYNQHRRGYKTVFEELTNIRYSLDEIQEFITESPKKLQKRQKNTKNCEFTALNKKRIRFIEHIIEKTNGNCKGRRENLAWLYYNAMIQTTDNKTAIKKLKKLNNSFKKPLPTAQINAIITEYERKQEKIGKTGINGYTETGYYKINSKKFLDILEATPKERQFYIESTSREIERKAARTKKEERNALIIMLYRKRKDIGYIATRAKCSESTVRRVIKAEKTNEDKAEKKKRTDTNKRTIQTEREVKRETKKKGKITDIENVPPRGHIKNYT